jgi:hypothetical protein
LTEDDFYGLPLLLRCWSETTQSRERVSSLPPVNRAQELTGHAKFEDVIPEGGNNRSKKLIHPSSSPIKWDEEAA